MRNGIKIIIVCLFCTLTWSMQGETISPFSLKDKTFEARADFGIGTLKNRNFSFWEGNSSFHYPQNIQAEMDYDSYSSFPEWSKNVTFHSAQEFLYLDVPKSGGNIQEFNSFNTIGVKSRLAGVEVFYNLINNRNDTDEKVTSYHFNKYGIGAGFPNSESLRLFGWLMHTDLSDIYPEVDFSSYKAQMAKRYRSKSQIAELGMEYEYNEIPDKVSEEELIKVSEYFPDDYLDWTPKKRFSAYVYASSIRNFYLEPFFLNGHAPDCSPLLLANKSASSVLCRFTTEDRKNDYVDNSQIVLDGILALNFGKYFGLDFRYDSEKKEDYKNDIKENTYNITGNMRLNFIGKESYRLIGILEYLYNKTKGENASENLNFGLYGILRLKNHLNLIAYLKLDNEWQRKDDFLELDHRDNKLGTILSVRL